jgi:hypothetical protein
MLAGAAVMLIVGAAGAAVTLTVAVADAAPPGPLADAVYVVVLLGLTCCVPPFDGSVYELPSEPLSITRDAFAAVTVNIDEPPAVTEFGFAETLMVGAGPDPSGKRPASVPHPATNTMRQQPSIAVIDGRMRWGT